MATVHISTLGCRLNQFESSAMAASLERAGHRVAAPGGIDLERPADVQVINTCTVTERGDANFLSMARGACSLALERDSIQILKEAT